MNEPTTLTMSGLVDQIGATLELANGWLDQWGQDFNLVQLARFIVTGCSGSISEAETVRQWVRSNIEYRNDPAGHELIQDPIVTLSEQAGDCDDMAILAGALLRAIGHECEVVAITWAGNTDPTHAVLMDYTAGVMVDPVASVHVLDWPPAPYRLGDIRKG